MSTRRMKLGTEHPVIKVLKAMVFKCDRCGAIVREFDNIGQWECKLTLFNPYTNQEYEVISDHGPVLDNPYFVCIPAITQSLLPISHRTAVSTEIIRSSETGASTSVVKIARHYRDTNLHSKRFLVLR